MWLPCEPVVSSHHLDVVGEIGLRIDGDGCLVDSSEAGDVMRPTKFDRLWCCGRSLIIASRQKVGC